MKKQRPKQHPAPGRRRKVYFMLTLTEDEAETLRRLADKYADGNRSAYARQLIASRIDSV